MAGVSVFIASPSRRTSTVGNPAKVSLFWQPDAPKMQTAQIAQMIIPATIDSASDNVDFISGILLLFVLVIPLLRKSMWFSFDVNDYVFISVLS